MAYLFVEYPKCTTCQKAKKWLEENGIPYTDRHIVEQNPTVEELKEWHTRSGRELKRDVYKRQASRGETLEQACMVHGVDPEEMVKKLNAHMEGK